MGTKEFQAIVQQPNSYLKDCIGRLRGVRRLAYAVPALI